MRVSRGGVENVDFFTMTKFKIKIKGIKKGGKE
jgi:hypothetical protein